MFSPFSSVFDSDSVFSEPCDMFEREPSGPVGAASAAGVDNVVPVPAVVPLKKRSKVDFNLSGSVHLTYPTHIVPDSFLKNLFLRFTAFEGLYWSICYEAGDSQDPYDHTHVFVGWPNKSDKIRVYSTATFDLDGQHCNIQSVEKSLNSGANAKMTWAEYVFTKYHQKAPVPVDVLKSESNIDVPANPFQFNSENVPKKDNSKSQGKGRVDFDMLELVRLRQAGVSVVDAMVQQQVPLSLLTQVKSLFSMYEPKYDFRQFLSRGVDYSRFLPVVNSWYSDVEREEVTLIVVGPSGVGKSSACLSLFKNPWVVRSPEGFKSLPKDCDGIVMDDCSFGGYKPESVIALLSMPSISTSQHCRFQDVFVRRMPLIITSNIPPFFDVGFMSYMFTSVQEIHHVAACKRRMKLVLLGPDKLFA